MEVILNIGLNTNAGDSIEANTALQAVADLGFFVRSSEVFVSDTEPTLVVRADITRRILNSAFDILARQLQQDCIAVYVPSMDFGTLVGPRSAQWLPFNPAYFIQTDGTRLGQQVAQHVADRQAQFSGWAAQRAA
jgi:hypothetical protein